jgi:hypothetical protein
LNRLGRARTNRAAAGTAAAALASPGLGMTPAKSAGRFFSESRTGSCSSAGSESDSESKTTLSVVGDAGRPGQPGPCPPGGHGPVVTSPARSDPGHARPAGGPGKPLYEPPAGREPPIPGPPGRRPVTMPPADPATRKLNPAALTRRRLTEPRFPLRRRPTRTPGPGPEPARARARSRSATRVLSESAPSQFRVNFSH